MKEDAQQGPVIIPIKKPVTLENLAHINRRGCVTKVLSMLIANGELADYDDELANRVKDAIEIVEGVCTLASGITTPEKEHG